MDEVGKKGSKSVLHSSVVLQRWRVLDKMRVGNKNKRFICYLRLHLIQLWVVWGQLNGLVPLLHSLPVPKENRHTVIETFVRKLRHSLLTHDETTTWLLHVQCAVCVTHCWIATHANYKYPHGSYYTVECKVTQRYQRLARTCCPALS